MVNILKRYFSLQRVTIFQDDSFKIVVTFNGKDVTFSVHFSKGFVARWLEGKRQRVGLFRNFRFRNPFNVSPDRGINRYFILAFFYYSHNFLIVEIGSIDYGVPFKLFFFVAVSSAFYLISYGISFGVSNEGGGVTRLLTRLSFLYRRNFFLPPLIKASHARMVFTIRFWLIVSGCTPLKTTYCLFSVESEGSIFAVLLVNIRYAIFDTCVYRNVYDSRKEEKNNVYVVCV